MTHTQDHALVSAQKGGGTEAPLLAVDVRHQAGLLALRARFDLAVERAALFGQSATGKSTLLRILAGLTRPDSGRILLDGRVLLDTAARVHVPVARRGIGFLTQAPALFPHLSVDANVRFGLRGVPEQEQRTRVSSLLALLGLEALSHRKPERLSGGERQRVALARALARRPRLLLLDEPFTALDAARKAQVWEAMESYLREWKIATLLVSHDAVEVWAGAASVVRISDGSATEQGPPERMLAAEREQILARLGAQGTASDL